MKRSKTNWLGDDMTKTEFEDALERVSEGDREWFKVNPDRQFHIRPIDRDTEFVPGEIYYPGARTVVAQIEEGIRTRWPFRQVNEALREDTDENAAVLLRHRFLTLNDGSMTTALRHVRGLQRESQGRANAGPK